MLSVLDNQDIFHPYLVEMMQLDSFCSVGLKPAPSKDEKGSGILDMLAI